MFESDTTLLLYWYALEDAHGSEGMPMVITTEFSSAVLLSSEKLKRIYSLILFHHFILAQGCFGRGICGVLDDIICVGTHEGNILVFHVPPKGTNITLSETLKGETIFYSQ